MTNAFSVSKSATRVVEKSEPSQQTLLFLDQLEVDVTGTIVMYGLEIAVPFVMVVVNTDSLQGNMIRCSAKSNIAHNFLRMKEGRIYAVKNFVVVPNKDEYRIFKQDMFMLEFDGETTVRKVSVDFRLVDLDQIEVTNSKYLIDVAGYVTNVGRTTYTKSGSKTLDFFLANQRGYSLRVTLWGGLGDVLVEWKTNHVSMCAVVLTGMSVKDYNNKLYLSSSSSTVIYDDDDIPCIQELKADSRSLPIDYPVFRYMLEVVVADDTASTVVVMFNDTAIELIKCSAE
ncbi:replication protein A 70 kDa DNA-binding subunit C-like protein [Tanacetum coccineum]